MTKDTPVSDDLRGQLERRLDDLRREYDNGQRILAELEMKQNEVRQTLLRIAGAIQVLEEMLAGGRTGDLSASDLELPPEA